MRGGSRAVSLDPVLSAWGWTAALAVPLGIVALYFLRLKRKPLQVPSTYLWKKSIEDLHVNAFWQRLRRNVLLWLQLLLALAILVALLRPSQSTTEQGERLIIMVDHSASMGATDESPTRLEVARKRAGDLIDGLKAGDAAMVLAFDESARVLCPYTRDKAVLRQAVASIEQTARKTNVREALSVADGLANPHMTGDSEVAVDVASSPVSAPATVVLVSDGRFPPVPDVSLGALSLRYVGVGTSGNNLGLLNLAARRGDLADRWQVLARVKNFHSAPLAANVELFVESQLLDRQAVDLAPGAETTLSFRLALTLPARLTAKLSLADTFPADNTAWLALEPPQRARVAVVGPDNPVLKAVLETTAARDVAAVTYHPVADVDVVAAAGRDIDLMIFDRCQPAGPPAANAWYLGQPPGDLGTVTALAAPSIVNWNQRHPTLRYVNLGDVNVARAIRVELPRGAVPLIESEASTLLFTRPRGAYIDLIQAFPLLADDGIWQTDWPLKPSFPLFVLNTLRFLTATETEVANVTPGSPARLRLPPSVRRAEVRSPAGRVSTVIRNQAGLFEIMDTDELGFYQVMPVDGDADDRAPVHFAVNLFDENESAVAPVAEVAIGSEQAADTAAQLAARREYWRWLAILAVGVLLGEWYVYNRRISL